MFYKNNFFRDFNYKSKKFRQNTKKTIKVFDKLKYDLESFNIPLLKSYEKNYELDFSSDLVKDKIYYGIVKNLDKYSTSYNISGGYKELIYRNDWHKNKNETLKTVYQNINSPTFKNFFVKRANSSLNYIQENFNLYKNEIIKNNILDQEIVTFNKVINFKDKKNIFFNNLITEKTIDSKIDQVFVVKYYGIRNYGILHKSVNSKKLLIYNQGHGGNSYNYKYFNKIKDEFLKRDYDLLNLNMPIRGFNQLSNAKMSFPVNPYFYEFSDTNIQYTHETTKKHTVFSNFYDSKYKHKKPFALFISGNYYLIKNIIKQNDYSEIIFVGHSGGGLMGLFYLNLFPEIEKGYLSASFLPKMYNLNSDGDWEYIYTHFLKKNTYFDLLFGSLIDENQSFSRKIILQYNKYDPVCCSYPYSESFSKNINEFAKYNNLNLKSYHPNKKQHKIDYKYLISNF